MRRQCGAKADDYVQTITDALHDVDAQAGSTAALPDPNSAVTLLEVPDVHEATLLEKVANAMTDR